MNRPIVLVDMDGVLADFESAVLSHVRALHPGITIPPMTKFRVHHNFDDEIIQQEIISYITSEGFFRNLPLIDGALDGWQRLIDLGYAPRICSTPIRTNPWSESEKRAWLTKHLGAKVAEEAFIDRNKYLHGGVTLIDDRTDLRHASKAPWQQILFDATYNQELETDYRLYGWNDPKLDALLKRIIASA